MLLVELEPGARERGLDAVEPRQHLSVRAHEREERDRADGEERDCGDADGECEKLGAAEVADPRHCAGVGSAIAADERDDCDGGEHPVPRQRLPARRRGVQLAEAVAVRRLAACEADRDRAAEEGEQRERADRAVGRAVAQKQECGDGELGQWQDDGERRSEPVGRAERDDGPPRARLGPRASSRRRRRRTAGEQLNGAMEGEGRFCHC